MQEVISDHALVEVHHGSLPEMPAAILNAFSSEVRAKFIVVNWLSYGLWEALLLHSQNGL